MEQLEAKFPNGKYWNHPAGSPSNQESWTDTPCTSHSSHNHRILNGACGCNCFGGLTIQCEGFALQLQEDAFGEGYGSQSFQHTQAIRDFQTAMKMLKAGDVIRFRQTKSVKHSIFITSVDGERIAYADCNAEGDCRIRWHIEGTKEMFADTFLYMDPGKWDLAPLSLSEPVVEIISEPPSQIKEVSSSEPTRAVLLDRGVVSAIVSTESPDTVCVECRMGSMVVSVSHAVEDFAGAEITVEDAFREHEPEVVYPLE